MLVSLKEYAELHGKDPATVRQLISRGGLKSAEKIGHNWIIDDNEPYPDRRRKEQKEGTPTLNKLKKLGYVIKESRCIFIGYRVTPYGITATRNNCDKPIYFLEYKEKRIPCQDRLIYLLKGTGYEDKIKSNKEARELYKAGKIDAVNCADVYSEWYDFKNDKELTCIFKYHCSIRSRKYIEQTMKNIGLIRYTYIEEDQETRFDLVEKRNIPLEGNVRVGESGDQWVAEMIFSGADDYIILKMYFTHKPSDYEIKQAIAIKEFENRFPYEEIYTDCEYGNVAHWLDAKGDIIEKMAILEQRT